MPLAPVTPGRLLLANVGLDGFDRGLKALARRLGDAGFECISTGLFQQPRAVAQAAVDQRADAIAVSMPSGAHPTLVHMLIHELWSREADIPVFVVGAFAPRDLAALAAAGVAGVVAPGSGAPQTVAQFASAVRYSA
ncbi:MAG: cobalamin B12-binding domain-containing protein [Actinobacteria bacterium]|nr:cobalamin B12-binding domain-containing protein [Actinomycetota bacterium]